MIIKDKKQIISAFLIVLVLIILSVFIIFFLKPKSVNNNLSINISSSEIMINNKLPISDVLGKNIKESDEKQVYITISIKNKDIDDTTYQIYLTRNYLDEPQLKEKYVKLYLTDSKDKPLSGFEKNLIPTYKTLKSLNDKPSSKLLYEGNISGKETQKLRLRVWIDDSYALSDITESFDFDVDVR